MSFLNRIREFFDARAEHDAAAAEMQFHIERETEHNIQLGMSPEEARRRAALAFGSVERFREQARDERTGTRLSDFTASWLDWKLGGRMLLKYPGLSLISGTTLAVAIALGAGFFEFSWEMRSTKLPLDGGDRIVRLENWDAATSKIEPRSVHDFLAWREQLTSIEQLGAYTATEPNLITADGRSSGVGVAAMSASGFTVARVPPLLGRLLTQADEEPGAPDVAVIGYDLWHSRFHADPGVIGQTVQLGPVKTTIVGVMPQGFEFPIDHQLWTPLRVTETLPRTGPPIRMFGRLKDGVSLESAQTELTAIGHRTASGSPATHAQLRPRVLAYAASTVPLSSYIFLNLLMLIVLGVAGANVATLMFARTALRESEIVVRNALGATRLRVMGQLFVESFVLSLVAAVAGLVMFSLFFPWAKVNIVSDAGWPFWWDLTIGPATMLYTVALAVFGAVIVGLLPALRATGPKVQAALRNIGGGGTHMQIGWLWSALIVFQVALAVLGLPLAIAVTSDQVMQHRVRSEFHAAPYLTFLPVIYEAALPASIGDTDGPDMVTYRADVMARLQRRLENEPEVTAFTYADKLPGMAHDVARVEMQRGTEAPLLIDTNVDAEQVHMSAVDIGFFDAFSVRLIAGRTFRSSDVGAAHGVVVINESLARNIGGDPIGVRLRTVVPPKPDQQDERSPWLEVVGVVGNLGLDPTPRGEADFMFTPASVATLAAAPYVALRVSGDAQMFEPNLRALAAQVAPELSLFSLLPLKEVIRQEDFDGILITSISVGVTLLVLLLSAAGLFALMSVAVARRTREIGIRVAIGASPRAVLTALFKRAATQIAAGIVIGNIVVVMLLFWIFEDIQVTNAAPPMLVASMIMVAVGMLACFLPARRALRVQPTAALSTAR